MVVSPLPPLPPPDHTTASAAGRRSLHSAVTALRTTRVEYVHTADLELRARMDILEGLCGKQQSACRRLAADAVAAQEAHQRLQERLDNAAALQTNLTERCVVVLCCAWKIAEGREILGAPPVCAMPHWVHAAWNWAFSGRRQTPHLLASAPDSDGIVDHYDPDALKRSSDFSKILAVPLTCANLVEERDPYQAGRQMIRMSN